MSVYRKTNSPYWHYDFQYKNHRFHGSTGKAAEREAKAVERAIRNKAILDVATGDIDKPEINIPTLDQAAAEWWTFKGSGLKSAPMLEARLDQAVRLIGKAKPVNEITTADIAQAIAKRRGILIGGKRPIKNATANRDIIDTIRPVIRRQKKLLNGGAGPPVLFPEIDWQENRLPIPKPKPRELPADQIGSLYDSLPIWWHDFARMQETYGIRLAEMFFGLSDPDPVGKRLRLRERKGDDDHYVPLLAEDSAMLAARIGRAKAAGLKTVWFRQLKTGRLKALTYNGAKWALRRAARDSGLHASQGTKGSHDLRHHAAMQYLRATDNLRATQKLLGHADLKSTLVYAHAMESDVRAGLDKVSRYTPEPAESSNPLDTAKPLSRKGK